MALCNKELKSLEDVIGAAIWVLDQMPVWQPEPPWVRPFISAAVSNPHDKLTFLVVESGNSSKEEPMQVGRTRLSAEEHQHHLPAGLFVLWTGGTQ